MIRELRQIIQRQPTIEGAGVHLHRVFGFTHPEEFDPFLLLDDFRSINRDDFIKGFPWHPHRGIETITYVLQGDVEHGDSLGNAGVITSGEVQWMTAGSGIIHQEMPKGDEHGTLLGFQLWANLPAADKMMAPRYRSISSSDIPQVTLDNGAMIKIIAGQVEGQRGPADDIIIDPEYLDCTLPPNTRFTYPTKRGYTVFIYCIDGTGSTSGRSFSDGFLVLFEDGDELAIQSEGRGLRFLLCSGRPIREPVAWRGPIVMNSEEELEVAFRELQDQTFIKELE